MHRTGQKNMENLHYIMSTSLHQRTVEDDDDECNFCNLSFYYSAKYSFNIKQHAAQAMIIHCIGPSSVTRQ